MAKRLTPFIGLAVVAALALAAAFGAFSLNPAYAGSAAPNARGLAQPGDFQAQAAPTNLPVPATNLEETAADTDRTDLTTATNAPGNVRLGVGGTFTFDVKNTIQPTTYADPVAPAEPDTYYVAAPEGGAVRLTPAVETAGSMRHYVNGLQVAAGTSTEVTITGESAGTALITVTVLDGSTTCAAPCAWRDRSTYTFSVVVVGSTLELDSSDPGANTRYDVDFVATTDLPSGISVITIELEDFGFPGSTIPTAVGVASDARYDADNDNRVPAVANTLARFNTAGALVAPTGYPTGLITPDDVTLSGEKLKITVPDMNPENDRGDGIRKGDLITIIVRQGVGISNPTEGKTTYKAVITNNEDSVEQTTNNVTVPFLVELDSDSGGRGKTVKATGKGFRNGTSLGFFLDEGGTDGTGNPDGIYTSGVDTILCEVARVGDDDTGSCSFTVNNPPFDSGNNYVNAIDGRSNRVTTPMTGDNVFELEPSITVSPKSGNPGETLQIQLVDFISGGSIRLVELARDQRAVATNLGNVGANGDANIRITIPDWASAGTQDLRVTVRPPGGAENGADDQDDSVNVDIGGPDVTANPGTVLPNQRISLRGSGFAPGARICCTDPDGAATEHSAPSIAIGGAAIDAPLINEDGGTVTVDSGGNWATSVDLPINTITTSEGTREIRVTDSKGRTGTVEVTIPARTVIIDPPTGRVGTTAVVRGEGFPSKNDEGSSFNVEITYTAGTSETKVSALPDASGRFEAELRIPTSANIPSTNTVEVEFSYGPSGSQTTVVTTVTHEVPKGLLTLSRSTGAPGTTVTVTGSGFNAFASVSEVTIGSLDITPIPQARTDAQGRVEFDVIIPGMNSGIQTLDVTIREIVSSAGFTVTATTDVGAETAVADGVVNMGENFVRSFNFNNDTKEWTFYDPEAGDASTQANFIAGATYWILVGQTQEVILNGRTRTLTCGDDGNCWNLIVW